MGAFETIERTRVDRWLFKRAWSAKRVLDVGSKPGCGIRASGRAVTSINMASDQFADIVGRAEALPFDDESFDAVSCSCMLEYCTHSVPKIIAEFHRVLVPGGKLWLAFPWCFPFHDDLVRWSILWFDAKNLENHWFKKVVATPTGGPFAVVHDTLFTGLVYRRGYALRYVGLPLLLLRVVCMTLDRLIPSDIRELATPGWLVEAIK